MMTFVLAFSPSTHALPTDSSQMIELLADNVEFDGSTQQGVYMGHVRFSQGSIHLEAAKARTVTDKNRTLTYAVAYHQRQERVHFWTQINPDDPVLHAYAETIEYFPLKHLIVLSGNAQIQNGKNELSAEKIQFDTLTHHLKTYQNKTQRTKILLYTDSNHANLSRAPLEKNF